MAWDTGLKEALVAYGPSNVPFELLPDGVKVGPLFFPYPTGRSYSGMSLSPYGGLSSPMISLLTVEQYTRGAMDYLNRVAGREAPSPRLLDNVVLGNMNDNLHPANQGVPIVTSSMVKETGDVGGRALFRGQSLSGVVGEPQEVALGRKLIIAIAPAPRVQWKESEIEAREKWRALVKSTFGDDKSLLGGLSTVTVGIPGIVGINLWFRWFGERTIPHAIITTY